MTFLNFSQLPESVFRPNFSQLQKVFSAQIFQENTFLETKPTFHLTGKCFSLINFSNDKQNRKVWKVVFRKPLSGKQTYL